MTPSYSLLHGDAITVLQTLPAETVNCVVTSPPYWGLRDYGLSPSVWDSNRECVHEWGAQLPPHHPGQVEDSKNKNADGAGKAGNAGAGQFCALCGAWNGCLGLEPTPELYVQHMVEIMREVRRTMRADATLWLNLGDTYKDKNLVGIPWRVALALQADDWNLRADVIWHKPNVLPESVRDRPTKAHEYIFLLTKSAQYHYDHEAIKEPSINPNDNRKARTRPEQKCVPTDVIGGMRAGDATYKTRNKRSVWTIPTVPFSARKYGFEIDHFAVYPPTLVTPCVLAGCPEGGTVLDIFNGAGTTGVVALANGRNYVGIDLNPVYLSISEARFAALAPQDFNV